MLSSLLDMVEKVTLIIGLCAIRGIHGGVRKVILEWHETRITCVVLLTLDFILLYREKGRVMNQF